jgi:outer membrane protein
MKSRLTIFGLCWMFCLLTQGLFAQQNWSLEKCVEYATQNSLSIKQAQNQVQNAVLTQRQNLANRYPSLNASTNGNLQLGRTVDPTTNSFIQANLSSNSINLTATSPIYQGGQIRNSIIQGRHDVEALKMDAATAANDLGLNVALSYLNILLSEEQLSNARTRLNNSRLQLAQAEKLIDAGARPLNEKLDALSQVATDEQGVIDAENQVAINYLALKQLMQLDPASDFKIDRPQIAVPADANPDAYNLEEIFTNALGAQPQIKAGDKRLESANVGIDLAKGGRLPTLGIFGNLNAFASSRAFNFTSTTMRVGQTAFINGQTVNFEIDQTIPQVAGRISYFDQINRNFGQSVGIQLSVPIYSNSRNVINIERARLNVHNVELNNQQLRVTLKSDIQNAIAGARNAKRSLEAAMAAENAAKLAFDNAKQRYDLGAINALEFNTARNNLDVAQINLTRAKFQYFFNVKQVEFYQGKKITLN